MFEFSKLFEQAFPVILLLANLASTIIYLRSYGRSRFAKIFLFLGMVSFCFVAVNFFVILVEIRRINPEFIESRYVWKWLYGMQAIMGVFGALLSVVVALKLSKVQMRNNTSNQGTE